MKFQRVLQEVGMMTEEEIREAKEEFDRICENYRKELEEARIARLKLLEEKEVPAKIEALT